jgi:cobalt-zinc-cadmium efflux system outer membrane protein
MPGSRGRPPHHSGTARQGRTRNDAISLESRTLGDDRFQKLIALELGWDETPEAAQAARSLAVANQYPNDTLSSGYNYGLGVKKHLLGIGAELPIFHENHGPIAQAITGRQQAVAAFTAQQAQFIGAVDQAAASFRSATRSLATGDALLADQQRRERQIENSFRAGQVDRPTPVSAQLVPATALSRFDAVVQQRQALGALEDALQQPLFNPGRFPSIPEENPRLVRREPPS